VEYPTVPKGQSRLKVTFHAKNTEFQVGGLVNAVYEWVEEMIDIEEEGRRGEDKISRAARQVYAWMADEKLNGFGVVQM
jgi:8-amino-7-oxononanoate synthase